MAEIAFALCCLLIFHGAAAAAKGDGAGASLEAGAVMLGGVALILFALSLLRDRAEPVVLSAMAQAGVLLILITYLPLVQRRNTLQQGLIIAGCIALGGAYMRLLRAVGAGRFASGPLAARDANAARKKGVIVVAVGCALAALGGNLFETDGGRLAVSLVALAVNGAGLTFIIRSLLLRRSESGRGGE